MSDTRLSFKEMCAKFDVTPRTLRYYEYIELLQPEKEGRARFYGPREVARMTLILRGRRFGFSLEEIRQWLLIYRQKGTEEGDLRQLTVQLKGSVRRSDFGATGWQASMERATLTGLWAKSSISQTPCLRPSTWCRR